MEFTDTTDLPAERCLQVNSCGVQRVTRHDYTILRSRGRGDYHLLYIQSGWITGEVGQVKVRADAGMCLVYLPGVRQLYTFSAEGDPISYWVHFTGTAAKEIMGFVEPRGDMMYTIGDRTMFEGLLHQLVRIHSMREPMYIPEENGILLQLIAVLARSSITKAEPGRSDVRVAAAYISEHCCEPVDLEACAAKLHLSLSRFSHLFTETMGISPHKYLLSLRIDRAKDLLLYSSMSIGEVSESVGFSDSLYFSRLFRRYADCSPSGFRNKFSKNRPIQLYEFGNNNQNSE